MDGWTSFWGWLLILVLVVFTGLVAVVGISGFRDIRELFRTIDAQHEEEDGDQAES